MSGKYDKQTQSALATIQAKGTTWIFTRRQMSTDPVTGVSTQRVTSTQTLPAVLLPVSAKQKLGATLQSTQMLLIAGTYEWEPLAGDTVSRVGTTTQFTVERTSALAPDGVPILLDVYIYQ